VLIVEPVVVSGIRPLGWLEPPDEPEPEPCDPTSVWVEVVTMSGRAAGIEFRFRVDTIEVWHAKRCRGTFDRAELRMWLAEPFAALVMDEVMLTLDRAVDHLGRIAITLPDVRAWTLSAVELSNLQDRV
jgi:hypothetical protein